MDRSALLPGQAVVAPARERVALVPGVERALEAVRYVVDAPETMRLQRRAGFLRAVAAAADEHDRPLGVVGPGELLHLADEVRIDVPVGAVVPGDVQRAQRMADEQVLHLAAAIDEQG